MKNNYLLFYLLVSFFFTANLFANNLEIYSSEIKLDKKESKIILKGNIKAIDESKNTLKAEEAFYFKDQDLLNSIGLTSIITSENYILESRNVTFDNKKKLLNPIFLQKLLIQMVIYFQ